jgi:hypothetical protein
MLPVALDEFPIHQAPLSMARVASSDKNFYDRSYLNCLDSQGDTVFITGFGVYPNLRVRDAFASVRQGDLQHTLRISDRYDTPSTDLAVGGFRIEVSEPLEKLRVVCDNDQLGFDLTWQGSFPAILEQPHLMLGGNRPTLDAQRFAQLGSWEGVISLNGADTAVTPDRWLGSRDRSWGIRPVGDPDPAGRNADEPTTGFWWLYAPIRFESFALIVIVQEWPDGYRFLNDACRVFPDGRIEQLGWPRIKIDYVSGTRHPRGATLNLTTPDGKPLVVEVEPKNFQALHVGCGYGGDPTWSHGMWRGADWSEFTTYDYATDEIKGRVPWGVSDFSCTATCDGEVGYGLFEHAAIGRHDPSGFVDFFDVAK